MEIPPYFDGNITKMLLDGIVFYKFEDLLLSKRNGRSDVEEAKCLILKEIEPSE